jgi:hypothetical protein
MLFESGCGVKVLGTHLAHPTASMMLELVLKPCPSVFKKPSTAVFEGANVRTEISEDVFPV